MPTLRNLCCTQPCFTSPKQVTAMHILNCSTASPCEALPRHFLAVQIQRFSFHVETTPTQCFSLLFKSIALPSTLCRSVTSLRITDTILSITLPLLLPSLLYLCCMLLYLTTALLGNTMPIRFNAFPMRSTSMPKPCYAVRCSSLPCLDVARQLTTAPTL